MTPAELEKLVESERERFGAPAVAVAVVRGGEVLLAQGFGTRDLATGALATPRTAFPLASNTKAFTAAALCVLAEEGRLDLDAPVQSVVPWFRTSDPVRSPLVTTRDLLAHRTGLPKHDLVCAGRTDLDLEGATRAVAHVAVSEPFRHGWIYTNLLYEVAGYVTECAAGQPWREVVRTRLLEPLGMLDTGFSARAASSGDFAFGYDDQGRQQVLSPDSPLGPPGCLVSTADDLARWLLARLGHGSLTTGVLRELHTPVVVGGAGSIPMPGRHKLGYALGCQVESYRGHLLVHHGGSLPGYSSLVLVAPEADLGVAVLTNLDMTTLPEALGLVLLDQLLGLDPEPWGERYDGITRSLKAGLTDPPPPARGRPGVLDLAECAGTYEHPAYGELVLTTDGSTLQVSFHDLDEILSVRHLDRDVWELVFFDGMVRVPLQFLLGPDGEVTAVSAPLEPAVDPIVLSRRPDPVDPELLERLPGRYAKGDLTLEVAVVDGRVVLDALGSRITLEPLSGTRFASPASSGSRLVLDGEQVVMAPFGTFRRTR
jgi:CubicO group peptidase (beta-lactamase class C family)